MAPRGYDDALAALTQALAFGIHPSLDGITELTEALGRPQDAFAVVQVTGTNGKTSTARLVAALLHAEGRRVGLYTSPELERYPERMEIDGDVTTDTAFAEAVFAALDAAEALRPGARGTASGFTEFELLTAAALWLFRREQVDVAVLEVGLGGRWDATSVAAPAVAVITGVGMDHAHILGDTLEKIAAEKAAIIRPASAPVLGPGTAGLEHIFIEVAEKAATHVRVVREGDDATPVDEALTVRFDMLEHARGPLGITKFRVGGVHGDYGELSLRAPAYQVANVATAVAAAEAALGRALGAERVAQALASVTFPGRFELVSASPLVIVDGSHNPQAAQVLATAIAEAWPGASQRPTVLLGVLADKDAEGIVAALAPLGIEFAVTQPDSPRAFSSARLAEIVVGITQARPSVFDSVEQALGALLGTSENGLIVTGSLVTAGEARRWMRNSLSTRNE